MFPNVKDYEGMLALASVRINFTRKNLTILDHN